MNKNALKASAWLGFRATGGCLNIRQAAQSNVKASTVRSVPLSDTEGDTLHV